MGVQDSWRCLEKVPIAVGEQPGNIVVEGNCKGITLVKENLLISYAPGSQQTHMLSMAAAVLLCLR